jgi:hypothetical protein
MIVFLLVVSNVRATSFFFLSFFFFFFLNMIYEPKMLCPQSHETNELRLA